MSQEGKRKRTVMIVFEETGVGDSFTVKLEGDVGRIFKNQPDLSPMELLSDRIFKMSVGLLTQLGATKGALPPFKKPEPKPEDKQG